MSLKISQFSSLNFSDWKHDFESEECYVQSFAKRDIIRVQLSQDESANFSFRFIDLGLNKSNDIALTLIDTKDNYKIYSFSYTGLDVGRYRIEILNDLGEVVSFSSFNVLEREALKDTIRLRYTHRENHYDVMFLEDEENLHFDFRVEGGFLYNEFQFKANTNNFRDQFYSDHQLSANPYETRKLTIGTSEGVPIWVGRKVNLIFSLSEVLINGDRYVRSEGSEPEIITLGNLYPKYVFKIDVEPRDFYSERQKEYPYTYYILGSENENILGSEDLKGLLVENN